MVAEHGKAMRRLSLVFLSAFMMWIAFPAYARFGYVRNVPSNSISTATLQPPTGLSALASCDGADSAKIELSWTASASSFADGYDVYRSAVDVGPYTKIDHITGRATVGYANWGLTTNSTYFYVLQSTAQYWTSTDSNQAGATTPATCP